MRCGGSGGHHRGLDVDVERLVQDLLGHFVQGDPPEHSHVVDQEVQAAQLICGLLNEGRHLARDTSVRRPRERAAPLAPDRLGLCKSAAAAFPVGEGDIRPLLGQRADQRAPQTPSPTGNHSRATLKSGDTHGAGKTFRLYHFGAAPPRKRAPTRRGP